MVTTVKQERSSRSCRQQKQIRSARCVTVYIHPFRKSVWRRAQKNDIQRNKALQTQTTSHTPTINPKNPEKGKPEPGGGQKGFNGFFGVRVLVQR